MDDFSHHFITHFFVHTSFIVEFLKKKEVTVGWLSFLNENLMNENYTKID